MTIPSAVRKLVLAATASGLSLAATLGRADPVPEIIVEAAAPVHSAATTQGSPGGASVDMLSVRYHVNVGSLDLTKHADVVALEQKVREAAKKGCREIRKEYPLRPMSDEDACVNSAVKNAMVKVEEAIAAAEKR
jgi:UrcA family protein